MVSAWAVTNGICLGEMKVDGKSNEITAISELIKALNLEQCIVTIDAAINFSAICKIVLMLLKQSKIKVGMAGKRKLCSWNEEYRDVRY